MSLAVFRDNSRVRLEFADDGGADTVREAEADLLAERGRGLLILRKLADDCGAQQDEPGRTTVWFELSEV